MTEMDFPNDADGDVLRGLVAHGDDITKSRDIDFQVVIPNEADAWQFAAAIKDWGYSASIRPYDDKGWDVTIVRHMAPTYQSLIRFQEELEQRALPFGGYNDGWGCFAID